MRKIMTLCIIHQHPRVLLGMKKQRFGAGRWNGFGGKLEAGETIEDAARREVKEEVGLEVKNLNKVGIIQFDFQKNDQSWEVHVFKSDNFEGEPAETEEMKPKWFHMDEIPFSQMWPDDVYWMPLLLSGKKFKGKFLLDDLSNAERASVILERELQEVDRI